MSNSPQPSPPPGRGNSLFGILQVSRASGSLAIQAIYWKRLFAALALFGIATYLAGATAVWVYVRYVGRYETISWAQTLLIPFRYSQFRVARGDELIARAERQWSEGSRSEAYFNLRAGVGMSPNNLRGRRLLAELLSKGGEHARASQLMVDSLPLAKNDTDFLSSLFQVLMAAQDDARIQQIAKDLLPDPPQITERNQLIALVDASSRFNRGRYDEAEETLRRWGLIGSGPSSPSATRLLARIEWERGNRRDAIALLERFTGMRKDDDQAFLLLMDYYRAEGLDNRAEATAMIRQMENPKSRLPILQLIYSYQRLSDKVRLAQSIEEYLSDFGDDRKALEDLGQFAIVAADVALADRLISIAQQRKVPVESLIISRLHALIAAGQYARAVEMYNALQKENPSWLPQYRYLVIGLAAVAHFGVGNEELGRLSLNALLERAGLRSELLQMVSTRLVAINRREEARQTLERATQIDPANQAALNSLVTLDLELGREDRTMPYLQRLTLMRKPSLDVLEKGRRSLSGDRNLLIPGRDEALQQVTATIAQRQSLRSR